MSISATTSRAQAAEFHKDVAAAFSRAAAVLPLYRRAYQIGDAIVRMEFAGDRLIPTFTRALAHLRVSPHLPPDLTIGIWEIAQSGVPLPPPPWTEDAYRPRGEISQFNNDAHFTVFHPDGRTLFVHDIPGARAYVAVFDGSTLPAYELAAPLSPLFTSFLETRGIQYLHAAAVGLPHGGVLLVGKGGVGKSTTSLACLDSELFFSADDYCAARFDGAPTVYSLYSTGKARTPALPLLPFLEPLISNRDQLERERAIWYLYEHFSARLLNQFPLRAILLPHITTQRDTLLEPTTPQAALVALAPTTLTLVSNAGSDVVRWIASLVRQVPAYRLNVGSDLSQIPQTILRVLEKHSP